MDLSWLEDFAALAETGNFSRAAEARHCTQPAFSRRIRALEDWVGATLFDRQSSPVRLTAAGERFRPDATEAWRRLAQARDAAREAAGLAESQLVVAATHALSLLFFPGWLTRLEAEGPLGPVRLVSDSLRGCEEVMVQGDAQFLLAHAHPAAPSRLDGAGFTAVTIGQDLLVPVAAPAASPDLDDSVAQLAYSPDSGMGRILAAELRQRPPLALKPVFTSHLSVVLRTMARDGRGVAWLPLSLVADDLSIGALVRLGEGRWDIPVDILLYRPRARQSPTAEAFWSRAGRC